MMIYKYPTISSSDVLGKPLFVSAPEHIQRLDGKIAELRRPLREKHERESGSEESNTSQYNRVFGKDNRRHNYGSGRWNIGFDYGDGNSENDDGEVNFGDN